MAERIHLKGKDARAVAVGHPWVYRQAVSQRGRRPPAGTEVDVHDERDAFLGRGLFDPEDPVAVRVWTRQASEHVDRALFQKRFAQAHALRLRLGIDARTDAYREVNAEGDRMPGVVVDRFGDFLALNLAGRALAPRVPELTAALAAAIPCRGVTLLDERRAETVHGEPAPADLVVREPTGRFAALLGSPGKSGLFTDMRDARGLMAPLLAGRSFLNLFAHTGAFSAMAAAAGAREVVSVDLSPRYLDVACRNVELSAPGYGAHETVAEDVFEALVALQRRDRRFDAVLIDPPSFSSSRKSGTFSIQDGYRPVVRAALRVLAPGGLLACATNYRGVTREQFLRMLNDAAHTEGADLRVLTVLGQPPDYPVLPILPETAYLQFALCAAQ